MVGTFSLLVYLSRSFSPPSPFRPSLALARRPSLLSNDLPAAIQSYCDPDFTLPHLLPHRRIYGCCPRQRQAKTEAEND